MCQRFLCFALFWCAFISVCTSVHAEANATKIDFAQDVFPILRRSCFECHGEEKQAGDLRLDIRSDAFASGIIDVDSPADSELLRRIELPRGDDEVMPAIGDPLSKKDVATLTRWIEQGAVWPEEFEIPKHWAYIAPTRPTPPQLSSDSSVSSAIDLFVRHRLEAEGLAPSPRATPEKLIRRVYLDLIGLPPTPAEVNAFLADPSDRHYQEIVDELLARPQFGERWARPWLDLARYADSHGFQRDNIREVWAYRDWVIRALNNDMPFDQFTIEQIAGDLLPNATESQRIATGFHRCTPTNVEAGSLPEETRIEQVIDRVNTTGAVWLGTTMECCQCHDHKYDPFSAKDYYSLLAFFNNTELEADRTNPKSPSSIQFKGPKMPLSNPERDAERKQLEEKRLGYQAKLKQRRVTLEKDLETWLPKFAATLKDVPQTHVLPVTDFQSQGTTDTHEVLEDGSVLLAGGDPPDKDVYRIRTQLKQKKIVAIQLRALRNDKIPGGGPGRGDPQRRNFVLHDFSVFLHRGSQSKNGEKSSPQKLKFTSAKASFSQNKWNVKGAIDDDPKSGWAVAPKFSDSHSATFILDEPIDLHATDELEVVLTQNYGQARTIGCVQLSAITGNVDAESIPENIAKLAGKNVDELSKADNKVLTDYRLEHDQTATELQRDITKLNKQIEAVAPDTTLVMIELPEPRPAAIFERGDYRKPGEPVQPDTPEVLHEFQSESPNRIDLANWLVSTDNPLVARVTVNRWWAEIFGQGIVKTAEDFGIKGDAPTHPELLDWLAVEFMESGWSMKQLLKTIVLSETYQQSSHVTNELLEKDDQNRLLARGPRTRMSAEMIRDNALAISGLLDLKQFGPPIKPYQPNGIWKKVGGTQYNYEVSPGSEQHRRGIYVVLKRGSPYPSFMNFDATARLACTVQRSRTNTPLQALTLLNDPVYVQTANAMADRITKETPQATRTEQLEYAFQLCVSRKPTPSELTTLTRLHAQQTNQYNEQQAWKSIATVLLNLHETITKD